MLNLPELENVEISHQLCLLYIMTPLEGSGVGLRKTVVEFTGEKIGDRLQFLKQLILVLNDEI